MELPTREKTMANLRFQNDFLGIFQLMRDIYQLQCAKFANISKSDIQSLCLYKRTKTCQKYEEIYVVIISLPSLIIIYKIQGSYPSDLNYF
ncbi:hypothetical protein FGO68_gene17570 [Halteria grandinella]|uniref:Uncharacterized protein n=1 Tax=Halteria grandinella TaxID=5974 RepID=A0A8J8NFN2_HALGN|nr:hypothetical protein FGO68_gene17570 [Halteria grandinella]